MEQTLYTLLKFRDSELVRAERERAEARNRAKAVVYETILACKHEHVGHVEKVAGFAAGRICLQCGLFEENHLGGAVFEHFELPYYITADVSRLITVPLGVHEIDALLADKTKLPVIIRRLVDIYC